MSEDRETLREHQCGYSQAECDAVRAEIERLDRELAALSVEHGAVKAGYDACLAALDRVRGERNQAFAENEYLTAALNAANNALADLTAENERLRAIVRSNASIPPVRQVFAAAIDTPEGENGSPDGGGTVAQEGEK